MDLHILIFFMLLIDKHATLTPYIANKGNEYPHMKDGANVQHNIGSSAQYESSLASAKAITGNDYEVAVVYDDSFGAQSTVLRPVTRSQCRKRKTENNVLSDATTTRHLETADNTDHLHHISLHIHNKRIPVGRPKGSTKLKKILETENDKECKYSIICKYLL